MDKALSMLAETHNYPPSDAMAQYKERLGFENDRYDLDGVSLDDWIREFGIFSYLFDEEVAEEVRGLIANIYDDIEPNGVQPRGDGWAAELLIQQDGRMYLDFASLIKNTFGAGGAVWIWLNPYDNPSTLAAFSRYLDKVILSAMKKYKGPTYEGMPDREHKIAQQEIERLTKRLATRAGTAKQGRYVADLVRRAGRDVSGCERV